MKKSIGVLLGIGLIIIVSLAFWDSVPKRVAENIPRVAANVLIEEPGRYRSPAGDCCVDIWEENEGKLKFSFCRQKNGGRNGSGPAKSFQAESDWFVCWDSKNRLWTYVPEQDHQRCTCWYANEDVSGVCRTGNLGGWEGIPPSFFDRLPDMVKETYREYKSKQASGKSEQDAEPDGKDAAN